jgi:hypothetical protein
MKHILSRFSFLGISISVLAVTLFGSGDTLSKGERARDGNLTLVGYVPNEYVAGAKDKNGTTLAVVAIEKRFIKSISPTTEQAASKISGAILLKSKDEKDFSVIYPGLINLHNHPKQNVIPVWGNAKGQFMNRFEWRGWSNYTDSVSGNMNPWVSFDKAMTCAAFTSPTTAIVSRSGV